MTQLGTVKNLSLREIWPSEPGDFTPWLAKNLGVLSEALGLDLTYSETEAEAGDFSADIVATEVATNRQVIIENQYGRTDHTHLGQVITYAATRNADVVVWVAEKIRAEHKMAVDFLNKSLNRSLAFYAVEATAIRIDDSKPAFLLTVVCEPAESATPDTPELTETGQRYLKFFQALLDTLRTKHAFTKARSALPQNWYSFSSERSRIFVYSANFAKGQKVRVEVYLDSGDKEKNERLFDRLFAKQAEIEAAFGQPLSWERLDERRASRIAVYRDGDIAQPTETLDEIAVWMVERLLEFKKVFPAYITSCLQEPAAVPASA